MTNAHTPGSIDPIPVLCLEFCGTWTEIPHDRPFLIGRNADLDVDDNPYLHRQFLELRHSELWWLSNVGTQLAATASDADGRVHAWLAPGARLPLVFGTTVVRFTAGPTHYELTLDVDVAVIDLVTPAEHVSGSTTIGRVTLTDDQLRLVLSLAEPALRRTHPGSANLPASAQAAARLGWPITKFNRKLDNVCQKLAKGGVQGLHGSTDRLASSRRARLVEYALAVRLVTPEDLHLLDRPLVADSGE